MLNRTSVPALRDPMNADPGDVRASHAVLRRQSAPARRTVGEVTSADRAAILDALHVPEHQAYRQYTVAKLREYLQLGATADNQERSDVERILAERMPPSMLDNTGDGALSSAYMLSSSPISLFGYMFWAASGLAKGAANMGGSGMRYEDMRREAHKEMDRLKHAQALAAATPNMQSTAKDLQDRIDALEKLRHNLQLAYCRRMLGTMAPGGGQVVASTAMLMLQIDRAPTLGGAAALLPPVAATVLGCTCGAVLGAFGVLWFVKNVCGSWQAWHTPILPESAVLAEHEVLRQFVHEVNQSIRDERTYTGINAGLSVLYTMADIGLIVSTLGGAIGPKVVWSLLTLSSSLYLITEYRWGRRFTQHNMAMPHLDRNYMNNEWHRAQTWQLLRQERAELRTTVNQLVAQLPASHQPGCALNPWKHISKKRRYALWGAAGFEGRLGAWTSKDFAITDPPVREYMIQYTLLEKENLRAKLKAVHQAVQDSALELERPDAPPELRAIHKEHTDRFWILNQRMVALDGLAEVLTNLNLRSAREDEEKPWNAARLNFLAMHHMLHLFFPAKTIKAHPAWFDATYRRGFFGRNVDTAHINLVGMEQAALHFDAAMEKRFVNLLLTPEVYRYERDAVLEDAKWARRERPDEVRQQLQTARLSRRYAFRESASSTRRSAEQSQAQVHILNENTPPARWWRRLL